MLKEKICTVIGAVGGAITTAMGGMKEKVCAGIGVVGGAIATAMGGWNAGLQALVIFMGIDYATGLMVAGIFHASPKTSGGGLESQAGWKGLCRKFMMLLMVLAANQIDVLVGAQYFRDAVVIALCTNELISIVENVGLIGLRSGYVLMELPQRSTRRLPAL